MYRSFKDFQTSEVIATDFLVGYSPTLQTEFKVDFYTISNIISGGITTTPTLIYVSTNGDDGRTGRAENLSVGSIKKAVQIAQTFPAINFTIIVRSGDYNEFNPIYVPPNTTIQGDNTGRVRITPLNTAYDVFWVTNNTSLINLTILNYQGTAAAVAFASSSNLTPGYSEAYFYVNSPYSYTLTPPSVLVNTPGTPLYITTPPYVYNCSTITTNGGVGVNAQGNRVGGYIKNIEVDNCSIFNQGGFGIRAVSNGTVQAKDIQTITCTAGVIVSAGGSVNINSSQCSYGLSGLVADGRSLTSVLSANLSAAVLKGADKLYLNMTLPTTEASGPNLGMFVQIIGDATNTFYRVSSSTTIAAEQFIVHLKDDINANLSINSNVYFYNISTVYANNITFDFVGSGTTLNTALPRAGGITQQNRQTSQVNGGEIFVTSFDETGAFKVGEDFTINTSTNLIEGRTFNKSVIGAVTPFVLSLE